MKKLNIKKILIPFFAFLFLSIQINAQTITGKIIDATSKEAIPYVNIGIVDIARGTVSDLNGNYELKVDSNEDLITISSIGYETIAIKAKDIENNTIELSPKNYDLGLVEVKADKLDAEEKIFGVRNKTRGKGVAFGNAQLGTQIGAAIKIKKSTYIKSANFVLNHAKGDSLLFRVNIYQFKEGEVGDNLLTENVIIKRKQEKGTITVDLEKYNIVLESDVILSLEWLRNFDEMGNKGITFDTKKSKHLKGIYFKYSSNGAFIKPSFPKKTKPCFYFIGKEIK